MNPDPYTRVRRRLPLVGAAIFAWLCATAALLGFGVPTRGRHHAAVRDAAMASTVPLATVRNGAGGQWLAWLLLAVVAVAVVAAAVLGLRRATLSRHPAPQPQQAVQTPRPGPADVENAESGWNE